MNKIPTLIRRIFRNKILRSCFFFSLIAIVSFSFSYLGYKIAEKPQIISNVLNILLQKSEVKGEETVLIKRIVSDVPILSSKNPATQFEIVNAIRNWAYKNIPYAMDEKLTVLNVTGKNSSFTPLTERFELFDKGEAGAWCGTTANTLMDLYELFGYEAYAINSGDYIHLDSKNTHVATLVKIRHNNQDILSLQDALYNYTLTDSSGDPLDYFDLISLLSLKKQDQVKILNGSTELKPYLTSNALEKKNPDKLFPNGNKHYSFPNSLAAQKESLFLKNVNKFLVENGYPQEFIYIYLFPFGSFGKDTDSSRSLLHRIRTITGYWCYQNDNCWIE